MLKFTYDDNDYVRYMWIYPPGGSYVADVRDDFDELDQMRREMAGRSRYTFSSVGMVR